MIKSKIKMETSVNKAEMSNPRNRIISLNTLYPRNIPATVQILAPQAQNSPAIATQMSNFQKFLC